MLCPPRNLGYAIAAFGVGIIVSAFIPPAITVVIEGAVIISAGFILFR